MPKQKYRIEREYLEYNQFWGEDKSYQKKRNMAKNFWSYDQPLAFIFIAIFTLGLGGICLFFLAKHFDWGVDKTGTLGDTIGGLSAPILGFLNAVLVYIAFRQQIVANRMQMKALIQEQRRFAAQIDFGFFTKILEDIKQLTGQSERIAGIDNGSFGLQLHSIPEAIHCYAQPYLRDKAMEIVALLPENDISELQKTTSNEKPSMWELWEKRDIHGINGILLFALYSPKEFHQSPITLKEMQTKESKKVNFESYKEILDESVYFLYRLQVSSASPQDKYYFYRQFKKFYTQKLQINLAYLDEQIFSKDEIAIGIVKNVRNIDDKLIMLIHKKIVEP